MKRPESARCPEGYLRKASVQGLPISVWLADPDGQLRFASSLWDDLLGVSGQRTNVSDWIRRLADEDASVGQLLRRHFDSGKDWEEELPITNGRGRARTVLLRGHAVERADGMLDCWIGVALDISHRVAVRQREMRDARDEGRLGERQRIARSLHGGVQQLLYAVKTHLAILRRADSLAHAKEAADTARQLVDETIQVSRNLIVDLGPEDADEFRSRLAWIAEWMRNTHGLEVDLHVDEAADELPPNTLELVFEAVRECLFNVVKHAETDQARVEMRLRPDVVELAVIDYGIGCDPGNVAERFAGDEGGFGLSDVRARCEALGGSFILESTPRRGTTVLLRWPRR